MEATVVYIDANEDGTVCLLTEGGRFCLTCRTDGSVVTGERV